MAISSRMRWALALGVLGAMGVVQVSRGQGDGAVKQAGSTGTAAAPVRAFPTAAVGSLDLGFLLRNSEKVKFHGEQMRAEMTAKNAQMQALVAQAKTLTKEMEVLTPGTADFKDRERKITDLKASLNASKENGEREFQVRYAEHMASFYADLQDMVKRVAAAKGLTYVVQYSSEPVSAQDPDALMARMQQPVIYASPETDITRLVLYNLNQEYIKNGGKTVKPPITEGESAAPAGAKTPATPPGRSGTGTAANPNPRNK